MQGAESGRNQQPEESHPGGEIPHSDKFGKLVAPDDGLASVSGKQCGGPWRNLSVYN
jgi:hypothetical protein